MQIEGRRFFDAPREAVWRAITDPHLMAGSMPSVENLVVQDEDHWTARIRVPLAHGVKINFAFELLERREPEHARLDAGGKCFGASMRLDTEFDLSEEGDGTAMDWTAVLKMGGFLGRVGEHATRPLASQLVDRMLNAVEREATRSDEPAAAR
jgi:hypothetical protein